VIANCDQGIVDYNHITMEQHKAAGWDNEYWHNVLDNADIKEFYINLEFEPNGQALLNWFISHHIPFTFLTRPCKEPNTQACIEGKKIWLKRNGLGDIPVLFERDKEKYAVSSNGLPNILIDDHSGNISKWNKAGGVEILYKWELFPDVIKKLEKLLLNQ